MTEVKHKRIDVAKCLFTTVPKKRALTRINDKKPMNHDAKNIHHQREIVMRNHLKTLGCVLLLSGTPVATLAAEHSAHWDMRLRHEHVQIDGWQNHAKATTLRARFGLKSQWNDSWSSLLEAEGTTALQNQFNSTANARSQYPVVADPTSAEINQAWLAWQQGGFQATLGRQRIILDNSRFVGNVGWRQNEQTFDALKLTHRFNEQWSLDYAYIDRAHRIFTDSAINPLRRESDLSTHLIHATHTFGQQSITGFMYLDEHQDAQILSRANHGLHWQGKQAINTDTSLQWLATWAKQKDHADNPQSMSHTYWHISPSVQWHATKFGLGREHLSGNGTSSFATPLATLHAFNGWGDQFLATPANGLKDTYGAISGSFQTGASNQPIKWAVVHHRYQSTQNDVDYGKEWNASLSMPMSQGWSWLVKYADYQAEQHKADTQKLWLQLVWTGKHPL